MLPNEEYILPIGIDIYNQAVTGGVAKTLMAASKDADKIPCIIVFEPRSQDGEPRITDGNICPTLNTMRGGQRQPCVMQTVLQKSDISNGKNQT